MQGWLQSDNAPCYTGPHLLVALMLINTRSPVKTARFIHTETQDGKGLVDAHFATAMAHVLRFMRTSQRNRIRAIATPRGLAAALAWNGGVTNSGVQLVRMDNDKKQTVLKVVEPIGDMLKSKDFSRCNDAFLNPEHGHGPAVVTAGDLRAAVDSKRKFILSVSAYSGIGEPPKFEFTLGFGVSKDQGFVKPTIRVVSNGDAEVDCDDDAGDSSEPVPVAASLLSSLSSSSSSSSSSSQDSSSATPAAAPTADFLFSSAQPAAVDQGIITHAQGDSTSNEESGNETDDEEGDGT